MSGERAVWSEGTAGHSLWEGRVLCKDQDDGQGGVGQRGGDDLRSLPHAAVQSDSHMH